jgi:nickel-dependent lactate racemase
MRVGLAYGSSNLDLDLPADRTTVVMPRYPSAAADPLGALHDALRRPVGGPPLRDLVRPGQTVAVSVCDITRAQPRPLMLRALLEELDGIVRPEDVVVIVATGTHRANTSGELATMLGRDVVGHCRVVNHDARDDGSLVDLGRAGDVPVRLAREWLDADVRISTGFVEPHFFAGFSGGPKMVAPGLAGLDTVLALHDARRIGDPRATWGICEGNPVHDAIRAAAALAAPDLALDVLLDGEQAITAAFAGPVFEMHRVAREEARREAMVRLEAPFDLVVTTNGGYPLDQNLYQAVKGMSAGASVVREGGVVVCAAECRDGVPDHGSFGSLLASRDTHEALLERIESSSEAVPDQWQVQVLARILRRARVLLHADGLTEEQIVGAHLEPAADLDATVRKLLRERPDARLCVLPLGPQTIPYIA